MASRSTSTARVADLERRLAEAEAARAAAETARIEAETRLAAVEEARARLERLLSQMRRDAFGAKSEKGDGIAPAVSTAVTSGPIEIALSNGRRVIVPPDVDAGVLTRFVQILERA
ncbi:hypothetical protein [Rhodobacter capsulatus]|uniref:hypothetical protein n=1 Tax=Rhodobacter capsulatus TaxID=1061 RepID=UPI004029A745